MLLNTCFLKQSAVKATVDKWESSSQKTRSQEVILTRMRIGHPPIYSLELEETLPTVPTANTANILLFTTSSPVPVINGSVPYYLWGSHNESLLLLF